MVNLAAFSISESFFDFLIREIDKINLYKEKNNLDIKNNKDRLENTIKSFNLLFKNNNEAQMKYIRQINEKNFKECKDMNEALNNRVCDLRIENAKYSIDLIKKSEEMGKDWNKILTIKEEMIDMVNEKINSFKKIFNGNNTIFNEFRKEYEEFKGKINDIINYFKEFRYLIENNNCQEKNNNINNCNNYTGCYINSNLPSEKKSFKHFSKFAKRAKSKNSKKNFIKSFMTINGNKSNYENNENGNTGLIHIECISKEKKNKIENNLKKNAYIQKGEPRSSKSVTKIEINSLNKVCASHDEIKNNNLKLFNNNINNNNINNNSNEIQIKINEEENKSEKNSNNSNNNSNIKINREIINLSENKEKDKEKLIIKINKKSRKSFAPSSKSIISYESENNNINDISNITSSHKDDLLTNSSLYSTNSFNVNRFNLYDNNLIEANQQVIKELASELEQSTNKKDMINSNKKKIEENFKINRSKISKLNLNKTTNIIDVTNSTEKTDDIITNNINKYASNNNINISISGILNKNNNNADNNVNNNNNINININTINKKMDLFDKKLFSLETLLKEKIIEILYQMEKLQNFFNISFNPNNIPNNINNINNNINNFKYPISSARIKSLLNQNSKEASVNFNNLNTNTTPNSFLMKNNDMNNDYINNINKRNSQDDYFIGCSIKRLAPIIEIDVNNLQFSPAPARTQYKIFSSKKKESRNKWNKSGMSTNYKDIKIKRNENKENINLNSNNNNGTQIRLFGKGANNLTMGGVNKWINLNKLINFFGTFIEGTFKEGTLIDGTFREGTLI